ncbi:MAG: hypothetical protein V4557_09655 [Bacteroidota bacterium]
MKNLYRVLFCICMVCQYPSSVSCQVGAMDSIQQKTLKYFDRVNVKKLESIQNRYDGMQKKVTAYSLKSLKRLQKQETKIRKKLSGKDSLAAKQLGNYANEKYAKWMGEIKNPSKIIKPVTSYLPGLDSMQTAFSFLNKSGSNIPGISSDKISQVKALAEKAGNLQSQLQASTDIQKFIKERKQQLQDLLGKYSMANELKSFNKEVYYYQQQLDEYKSLINDPGKLEQKVLGYVREIPAFKDFMSKNSFLSKLFPSGGSGANGQALPGLQTRTAVQQQFAQQSGGPSDPQQMLQQQVQEAQGELSKLKVKLNQLGGGSGEIQVPDFKPNNQKTKSFWKRLEYGLNIQSQGTSNFLPATSDIALLAGYKINDKNTVGMGAGYKLGWGKNISNINLTSQGISLRSYLDMKLKGSIWISGGYEYNYQNEFEKIDELKNISAWQKSGLIGLSKKYKIGKKNGNLQLLWDFLSYSQVPKTTALKFRLGYSF